MKVKTCKGNYRVDKFKGCGSESYRLKYGLCPSCLWDWMNTTENGKIYYSKQFVSNCIKSSDRYEREKKKKLKEKNKTITQLINEAKLPFQKWIRFRDANLPCISCGTDAELNDGGHFYKAEIYRGLIFNENNCHKQCRKCNQFLGGNENNYRLGLIARYGEDFVKDLDKISDENRTKDWTREEIKQIKQKYNLKLKL